MSDQSSSKKSHAPVATNRKARRDYHVLEEFEAGIELTGTEVKSVRQGNLSLDEGYAKIAKGQVWLHGVHIQPYDHGNVHNHEPRRPRRLLLHRREINRLIGQLAEKGLTLVPLSIYFKNGKVKILLALGRGKHSYDKRETIRQRDQKRDLDRSRREYRQAVNVEFRSQESEFGRG